ncbi:Ubiquitin fusion degradation protein 4 [Maudiozyma exigua]|uniref:HECT-type E3 ubiquitin transferase n=1 Tax=Maudiozyma exigua TaxID=34358 RepID=A0A9P6W5W2_MAUEX|nr:Ubiquitin fusion degradation protein 4 [Kazachstania exigua]
MNGEDNDHYYYHEDDEDDTNDDHYYNESEDYHIDSSSHNESDDQDSNNEEIHRPTNNLSYHPRDGETIDSNGFIQQFSVNTDSDAIRCRHLEDVLPGLFSMMNGNRMPTNIGTSNDGPDSRIGKLVDNVVHANDDPYIAMESLKELSESMLMMSQLIVDRAIPTVKLVGALVDILSSPFLAAEMELQMQASRCLYNLFEVNPDSTSIAVDKNVIKILSEKLAEINFIDLAEQVLETLEYISRVHGKDILEAGNLTFYIQYYDFFTIHAQRKAIAIVSNAMARVERRDFRIIKDTMVLIQPIFQNASDKNIQSRLINALYGIAQGIRESYMTKEIFSASLLEHILSLTSGSDVSLEDKLNCFDILTVIVSNSRDITKTMIDTMNIPDTVLNCLNSYSKSSTAALHETLMFVPNEILLRVSRFIALLMPPEKMQMISTLQFVDEDPEPIDGEKLESLVNQLTPVFVDIYMNSMDMQVRKIVLLTLLRFVSCIKPSTSGKNHVNKDLARLIGSALAQNKKHVSDDKIVPADIGILIFGTVQLATYLIEKYGDSTIDLLRREGIFEIITELVSLCNNDRNKKEFRFGPYEDDEYSEDEDEDEDEDEFYTATGSDFDIPDGVKPKKIKFSVFDRVELNGLVRAIFSECEEFLATSDRETSGKSDDLYDIKETLDIINATTTDPTQYDDLVQFWSLIKDAIFKPTFTLSPFEFFSSGLASCITSKIKYFGGTTNNNRRVLVEVFGDRLVDFVDLLQDSLTRAETFTIVDCLLFGDDGGMASLGKQMAIELIPDTSCVEANHEMVKSLKPIMISIQCISSFKTCCEFIKNRLLNISLTESVFGVTRGVASSLVINTEEIDILRSLTVKNFTFKIGDSKIPISETIFGAVYRHIEKTSGDFSDLWNKTHSITYTINLEKVERFEDISEEQDEAEQWRAEDISSTHNDTESESIQSSNMLIDSIYGSEKEKDIENGKVADVDKILPILKFLRANIDHPDIFINAKLSAKLSKQLDEPIIIASGALPDWTFYLTKDFSFLFPFEARLFFLKCISFGYGRLIQLWKNKMGAGEDLSSDNPVFQLGRIGRHKLRISRDTIFLTGLKILDKYGSNPSILEMEYQNEAGTGLGPTLEFYACMSKEFTKKNLNMWRIDNYNSKINESEDDMNQEYVTQLLFPLTVDNSNTNLNRVKEFFSYLGTFIARSMLDNRILDFNFNPLFFSLTHELARNKKLLDYTKNIEQSIDMISSIDKQIGNSLKYIYENRDNKDRIEELYLTYVIPGTETSLTENGENINVTSENVMTYINLLISSLIGTGIEQQLQTFIDGFSKVFPYENLLVLLPEELIVIFGSVEEDWSEETLYGSIVSDHGYTMDSQIIHDLIDIMSSFNAKNKRLFTQFLTGSPRLPFGGFKSLKPKFTVVLKHAEDGLSPDQYLPSVMTCANYLKLPKYSNKEVMRTRIQQAIEEGAGAFLLS